MKKLFLLRGVPGSGKSTFLNKYSSELNGMTISADQIRLIFSPTVYPKNSMTKKINQENDKQVWDFIHDRVRDRLLKGYTTIVDATHCNVNSIEYYKSFCKENDVNCVVVEFNESLEICKERNRNRPSFQEVPEFVIDRMHENMQVPVPNWCEVITPQQFSQILDCMKNNTTDYSPLDYNKFKDIVIFGDIHGCYEPIKEYFEKNPCSSETKYIFVGDYEDRGIQNKEVFEFLISHSRDSNFLFLRGNHTIHTLNYSMNLPVASKEFKERTIQQLQSFDKSSLKKFCKRQGDFSYFTFCNEKFLVTHAGVDTIPNSFTNERDITNGVGGYEKSEEIDDKFRHNHPDVYTIHGHRNLHEVPLTDGLNTGAFNLEGGIEFGGHLRYLTLHKDNDGNLHLIPGQIKNNVFRKIGSDEDIIQQLVNSRFVKVKSLDHDIKSYSFTKECFFDKRWDALTEKARGLFCRENTVVARSFDKFFNIGERENLESIVNKMSYPVSVYKKENGFLGIVSYDPKQDDLFVSSKSTNKSDYALYFKDVLLNTMDDKGVSLYNKLLQLLKEKNYSLVFEVCNSEIDPHIVKYEKTQIFLLEAFENSLKEISVSYEILREISLNLDGVQCKELCCVLNSPKEMLEYINSCEEENYSAQLEGLEGFVLEGSNHFRVKYKTRWYRFWKYIRNHFNNLNNISNSYPEFQQEFELVKKHLEENNDISSFMIKNLIGLHAFSVIKFRDMISDKTR